MEVQLNEIIAKLKSEGVEEAQRQGQQIVEQARVKAQDILNEAEQQAKRVRRHAEEDAKRFERSGVESVRHAGRDLVILVKKNIEDILQKVLQKEVKTTLTGPQLVECIASVVRQWRPKEDLVIQLPPEQADKLASTLVSKIQQQAEERGVEIVPFPELAAGFRVTTAKGAVVYDFGEQEVTLLLSHLLNPRFAALLS